MNEPISNTQDINALMALANIQRQIKSGATNYYWIAGLSIVNSLGSLFSLGISFVVGLGITQLIDAIAFTIAEEFSNASAIILTVGVVASISVAALFAFFGYFAIKGRRWAFIVGMILYSLDALLMLVFEDWIGFGFHLLFLWGIYGGFKALKNLESLSPQTKNTAFPSDINSI